MDLQTAANELGINLKVSVGRFAGKEALYLKYLKKFTEDKTYSQLCAAMETMSPKDIEVTAHTLKGIAANLGLDTLSQDAHELVQAVRNDRIEDTPALYEIAQKEYECIIAVLKQMD